MKFAIAYLAAAVYAEPPRVECPFKDIKEFLFGEGYDLEKCPELAGQDELAANVFMREHMKTIMNSFWKGWYQDSREDLLDEQCLSDWMDPKTEFMGEIAMTLKKDGVFAVTQDQFRESVNDLMDVAYTNYNSCKPYNFIYDKYNWCSNNIGTCVFHEGILDRLQANSMLLASKGIELATTFMQPTQCLTDQESLKRTATILEDVGALFSTVVGFEGHYDTDEVVPELSCKEMHEDMKTKIDAYKKEHGMEEEPKHEGWGFWNLFKHGEDHKPHH